MAEFKTNIIEIEIHTRRPVSLRDRESKTLTIWIKTNIKVKLKT